MAVVNHLKKEINAKVVYYGPGLSGKATNLNHIFRRLKPEHRGKLKLMNIQSDRMLFFDFTPVVQNQKGYDLHLHIYTIIGQSPQAAAWKLLLKGVDGLVFVADSCPGRMVENRESLKYLREYLDAYRKPLYDIPLVFQCNKQDMQDAVRPEEMQLALDEAGIPMIPAEAANGKGVLESLFAVVKLIQKKLREEGLELDKDAEQSGLSGNDVTAHAPDNEPDALPEIAGPVLSPPAGHFSGVIPEPFVEFDGEVEQSAGCLRLPLVIKCGDRKEKFALTLSLSKMQNER